MPSRYSEAFATGLKDVFKPFDEPGPDITVSPFAPGEVTTGAGILRAITAAAGARRARANWQVDQQDKAASRYAQALEVQALEKKLNAPDYEQQRIDDTRRYRDEYLKAFRERTNRPPAKRAPTATERAANASLFKLAMGEFDKQGEAYADEQLRTPRIGPGGRKLMPVIDTGQRLATLLAEAKTPSEQLKYAKALGVTPVTANVQDAQGTVTSQPVYDSKRPGMYTFDPAEVSKALGTWTAARREGLLNEWRTQNAGKRSAYEQALMQSAFGDVSVPQEDDPLMEAMRQFAEGP